MFSRVATCGLTGLEGHLIEVEIDISNGIPGFDVVGLAETSVKEARERVKAAIKNSGFRFPGQRITLNLAPADIRKDGTDYDLPIAIGILVAAGVIPEESVKGYFISGELALDGSVRPVPGMLCKAITAKELQYGRMMIPAQNLPEVSVVRGIEYYPVNNLNEAVAHFTGEATIKPAERIETGEKTKAATGLDFSDVLGQNHAKRALEVAASGGHNVIMIGSPGSGKTMLARRLPTILPDLSFEESMEVTKIYSVAGMLPPHTSLITERPFRAPHHTMSAASLVGGGRIPKPGEVSLSHYGVLFLDELPEFGRTTLDILRQPMEDGFVCIARINSTITYPSRFMLVAAANPCKCGYYGDPVKPCTCSPREAEHYLGRLSGPLMDRIDIQVQVPTIRYSDLESRSGEESSEAIKKRVCKARAIQKERYRGLNIFCNAGLTSAMVREFCKVDDDGKRMLRSAFDRLKLSARAHDRILKVARTIADLEESPVIQAVHIAEAIQYRSLDRTILA
ncbi:MAG: YifB family Mg chelatase-like AAA ATPase [Clostridiaceae bacterium]|nr:YifB family Mg chelatase-like AAA ATPase [Clostridiaceae bacterium]